MRVENDRRRIDCSARALILLIGMIACLMAMLAGVAL